jgi:hypothetical protein
MYTTMQTIEFNDILALKKLLKSGKLSYRRGVLTKVIIRIMLLFSLIFETIFEGWLSYQHSINLHQKSSLDFLEVDETLLHVCMNQLHANPATHVHPFEPMY